MLLSVMLLFRGVTLIQIYHKMYHEAVDIPLIVDGRNVDQVLKKLTIEGRGAKR